MSPVYHGGRTDGDPEEPAATDKQKPAKDEPDAGEAS